MKIQTTNGKTIDTNTQTDIEAEITEAVSNLFETCKKYNVPLLIRALPNETTWIGAQYMLSGEKVEQYSSLMFYALDKYVSESSGGNFAVVQVENDSEGEIEE